MRRFLLTFLAMTAVLTVAAKDDVTNFVAVVTVQREGEKYFFARNLQDGKSWRVSMGRQEYRRFVPGERVSVSAKLEPLQNRHTRRVFDAEVSLLGFDKADIVKPRQIGINDLYRRSPDSPLPSPDWYGDFVSVEGKVIDCNRRDTITSFLLYDNGDHLQFSIVIPIMKPLPEGLVKGAVVRVKGAAVYSAIHRFGAVVGFENVGVIVNDAGCVEIISRAPFWTYGKTLALIGVLIGVILIGLVWLYTLRRTVARMEMSIREKVRDRIAAEAARRERLRLSCDLHDDFQQLLASSTFRLAAAQNKLKQGAGRDEVLAMLGKVEDSISHAQAGLRSALWSMSEEAEGPSKMSELFCYAAERLEQWNGHVKFEFMGIEPAVSSRYAGNLLMVLQEAVGNALRHGGADMVTVNVSFNEGSLEMSIVDDGSGFEYEDMDMNSRSGMHLGISGMRARTMNSGGTFKLASEVGKGTQIIIKVPFNK